MVGDSRRHWIRWMRLAVAALVCASSCTLVGCSSGEGWPVEVTAQDREDLRSAENASLWDLLEVPDAQRPEVVPGEPADVFLAAEGFVACMRAAGYIDNYTSTENSIGMAGPGDLGTTHERVQWYRCFVENPRSHGSEVLGSLARRGYLYDYYRNSLVPCLATLGYRTSDSPSRAEFLTGAAHGFVNPYFSFGLWSPYDVLTQTVLIADVNRVKDACPPVPDGVLALHEQDTFSPFATQNG